MYILFIGIFTLFSCGKGSDTAVVTYIVTTPKGGIQNVLYIKENGTEASSTNLGQKNIWRKDVKVKDGDLVFVSATSVATGKSAQITARIFSNGVKISEQTASGEEVQETQGGQGGGGNNTSSTPAFVSAEGFAQAEPLTEEDGKKTKK